jgi:hypothetical protein
MPRQRDVNAVHMADVYAITTAAREATRDALGAHGEAGMVMAYGFIEGMVEDCDAAALRRLLAMTAAALATTFDELEKLTGRDYLPVLAMASARKALSRPHGPA